MSRESLSASSMISATRERTCSAIWGFHWRSLVSSFSAMASMGELYRTLRISQMILGRRRVEPCVPRDGSVVPSGHGTGALSRFTEGQGWHNVGGHYEIRDQYVFVHFSVHQRKHEAVSAV